jgi:type I restriction enzyme S subunit
VIAGVGFPERLQGRQHGQYPFFKVGDISRAWQQGQQVLVRGEHYVGEEELAELRARPVPADATVFAKIGAAVALNRRALLGQPSLIDNNCFAVLPNHEMINKRFLFYYLCGVDLGQRTRATTVPSLRKGDVEDLEIPAFSLRVQHRIVAAIETHFSRLDAAVASLTRAKANVKRARASVLKAAVEGRLVPTEAALARAEGREYEPAAVLLGRILAERKAAWASRKDAKAQRGKYQEPVKPETEGLPGLPEGWTYCRIDTAGKVQLGRQRSPKNHDGPDMRPYLRVANVFEARIDLSDVMEMNFTDEEFETYRLHPGDILLNEGQSPHLVGRPAMWDGQVAEMCFTNSLVRFQAVPGVLPAYALAVFRAQLAARRYMKLVTITTNIAHLGAQRFAAVEFPLPPLAEQHRIVAEVDRRLSVLDALDATLDANLARCGRLRQAVLKRAFEGRLVPAEADAPLLVADSPKPQAHRGLRQ